jgi:hypothetical protein
MATEKVDLIFGGDPSDAVNAAKQVEKATNDVGKAGNVAGESFLRIGSEIAQMKGKLKGAAVALAAFTATVYAVLRPFKSHVSMSKELAENLEISAEKAQELALAEKMAGLEAGTVRDAIESIAELQAQGMVGGISNDFLRLGVSLEDIRTKKPDEIFDKIADNAKDAELGLLQINAATKVLGSNGVPLIKSFSENFQFFRDEAKESGKIISDETFEKIIKSGSKMFATIEIFIERVLKKFGGFESIGDLIATSFEGVSKVFEKLVFLSSYIPARFKVGLETAGETMLGAKGPIDPEKLKEAQQAGDLAAGGFSEAAERRANEYVAALGQFGLTEEKAAGAAPLIEGFKKRTVERSQNIDALQRVGLAQTAGASESLKIQRAMLGRQTRMVDLLSSRL